MFNVPEVKGCAIIWRVCDSTSISLPILGKTVRHHADRGAGGCVYKTACTCSVDLNHLVIACECEV